MKDICRLCLRNGELISIFSAVDSMQISAKVMYCASVRILEGDKLPSNICPKCIERLDNSYDFKVQCEESDLKLRETFEQEDSHDYEDNISIKHEDNYLEFTPPIVKCEIEYDLLEDNKNIDDKYKTDVDAKNVGPEVKGDEQVNSNDYKDNDAKKGKKRGRKKKVKDDYPAENNEIIELSTKKLRKPKDKKDKDLSKITDKVSKEKKIKDPANKTNQCYTCGKIVSSRFRLKMHMRTHTGERPYSCSYCNKTFALSQNLKVHERVHTGEKPLLCGICGKTFAQSAGLVAHMRLHTGETPYKCDLCPSSFRTPGHLQYHIRQHTGEKNFECEVCNRAFITKGDLTQHRRTHTGERPYVCTVCGLRMSRSSHLTRHMLTHTGEKPHKCDICGSAYAQKGDLVRHIKKHAGENRSSNPMAQPPALDSRLPSTMHHSPSQITPLHSSSSHVPQLDARHPGSMLDRLMDSRGILDNRSQMSQLDPRALGLGLGLGLLHSHHV